ncbi:Phospholipase YtpA [Planococcus massiliensis]|uniref:Phospholipase YtpA n=1 Tax=Planococcus massiliensis TaxID=1499687 RepID=A0A098EMI6_9BACL|nr:Phospholipase YtpA [Planococcus massiliensis]
MNAVHLILGRGHALKITKNFIRASDRVEIYYEIYEPENPVAHVHIIHGMAEHFGRYEEFARFLANHGFVVSGHDQRGHGQTARRNGTQGFFADFDGFNRIVEDAGEVVKGVQSQIGELPFILFGHSMGSFVARRYIQLHSDEIAKAVISGTGGDPGVAGKAGLLYALAAAKFSGKEAVSPTLGKLTFGSFIKPFKDEGSLFAWLSRDKEAVEKYENDPMSGQPSTNQFYVDLFHGLSMIHKKAEIDKIRKDLPMLLISGAEDPVGDSGKGVFAAAKQYQEAGMTNVKLYLAEGGRHELLHETNKQQHFDTLVEWMGNND